MGGVCDGSDPTDPVECGNSQHSPPTSLEHDIARLQPVLLISSKFLKLRMSGPMDVHGGSGWAVYVMALTQQTLSSVATASKTLQQSSNTTLLASSKDLLPVLLISSKFLNLGMSGPMDVHGGSG